MKVVLNFGILFKRFNNLIYINNNGTNMLFVSLCALFLFVSVVAKSPQVGFMYCHPMQ